MMKQCSSDLPHSSLFASATEDELFVSQILLELGNLVMEYESPTKFMWGRKKRRSSFAEASSSSPEQPTPLPPEESCAAAKTSSPTSPLSFFPSESEEKAKHSSKKRSRDKYTNTIEELMECGDLLRGELEKVRNYYNELRIYNSELKALKFQVLKKTCPKKDDSQRESVVLTNLVMNPTQHYRPTMLTHQQPFIGDPRAHKIQQSSGPIAAHHHIYNGLEQVNQVGPSRIPDLNLSAEEAFGVDTSPPLDPDKALADRRARFAEARRMRRGIIKIKSMRSACGIKLPGIRF